MMNTNKSNIISLVVVVLVATTSLAKAMSLPSTSASSSSSSSSLSAEPVNLNRLFNDFEMSSNEHQENIQSMKKTEKLFLLGLFFKCIDSDEFADCVDDSLAKKMTNSHDHASSLSSSSSELFAGGEQHEPESLFSKRSGAAGSRESQANNDSKEMLSLLRHALVKNIRLKSNIKTTRF